MTPAEMKNRLEKAYPGGAVTVVDLTGTADHYQVSVTSKVFAGMSRIERHRHVNEVFAEELKTGEVHALTIQTQLPTE